MEKFFAEAVENSRLLWTRSRMLADMHIGYSTRKSYTRTEVPPRSQGTLSSGDSDLTQQKVMLISPECVCREISVHPGASAWISGGINHACIAVSPLRHAGDVLHIDVRMTRRRFHPTFASAIKSSATGNSGRPAVSRL